MTESLLLALKAIYSKGAWEQTFNNRLTRDEPFYAAGRLRVPKSQLHQEEDTSLLDHLHAPMNVRQHTWSVLNNLLGHGFQLYAALHTKNVTPAWERFACVA